MELCFGWDNLSHFARMPDKMALAYETSLPGMACGSEHGWRPADPCWREEIVAGENQITLSGGKPLGVPTTHGPNGDGRRWAAE